MEKMCSCCFRRKDKCLINQDNDVQTEDRQEESVNLIGVNKREDTNTDRINGRNQTYKETSRVNRLKNSQESTGPSKTMDNQEDTETSRGKQLEKKSEQGSEDKGILRQSDKQETLDNEEQTEQTQRQPGYKLDNLTKKQNTGEKNDHKQVNHRNINIITDQSPEEGFQESQTKGGLQTLHRIQDTEAAQDEANVRKESAKTNSEETNMEKQNLETDQNAKQDVMIQTLNETKNELARTQKELTCLSEKYLKTENELMSTKNELKCLKLQYDKLLKTQGAKKTLLGKEGNKVKHVVDVQILQEDCQTIGKKVIDELISTLRVKLNVELIQMNIIRCSKPSDVKRIIPLIVVCFAASRIVEDVLKAVNGIHDLTKVMLLIFHHTQTQVKSSKVALKDQRLQPLNGRVVDIAFHHENGLNLSSMNETSMEEVAEFIRKCYNIPV